MPDRLLDVETLPTADKLRRIALAEDFVSLHEVGDCYRSQVVSDGDSSVEIDPHITASAWEVTGLVAAACQRRGWELNLTEDGQFGIYNHDADACGSFHDTALDALMEAYDLYLP